MLRPSFSVGNRKRFPQLFAACIVVALTPVLVLAVESQALRAGAASPRSVQGSLAHVMEFDPSRRSWHDTPASLSKVGFRQDASTDQDQSRGDSSFVSEGAAFIIYFVAIAFSLVVSLTVLRQYRLRVKVLMKLSKDRSKFSESPVGHRKPITPKIEYIKDSPVTDKAVKMWKRIRRTLAVYTIAGFCQAIMATFWWMRDQSLPLHVPVLTALLLVHLWPLLVAYFILYRQEQRIRLICLSLYLALLVGASLQVGSPTTETEGHKISGALQFVFVWAALMILPTIAVWSFLRRQVRAAGPLTFTMCLCTVIGIWMGMVLIDHHNEWARDISVALFHSGASIALFCFLLAGSATGFVVGWWLSRLTGFFYQHKVINHQTITLDALYLNFSIADGIHFVIDRGLLVGLTQALTLFAAYRIVLTVGLIWLNKSRSEDTDKLLFLRVFRENRETDKLMSVVGTTWLYCGSIQMMGAFDLASSAVRPNQFLDFIGGKLSNHFLSERDDLQQRLRNIDCEPDWDGRYRVNEVLCQGNIWKQVLQRLTHGAVVLMDLRGFKENGGCRYELRVLFETVPLDRIVIVSDEPNGRGYLHKAVEEAWQSAELGGPNDELSWPSVKVIQAKRISAATGRSICNTLLSPSDRDNLDVSVAAAR